MTHGSLFSGIGGFDLAAEWMGWQNIFHCEWNPFGQKVLHHYWPHSEQFIDITKSDFTKYANKIDILTGGFPCQPYSSAGKRLGKEDERHLWPEMLRAIREIQPRWIVGENVRGLTNWNGGMVFNEVQADLEAQGYEVTPFLLPACAVNAPHRRDRIWFVAYCDLYGLNERNGNNEIKSSERRINAFGDIGKGHEYGDVADTSNIGRTYALENGELERERFGQSHQRNAWDAFPSVFPICNGNDGISDRLDSITFPKWRNESIKAGGNAIVPQVVYQIFKAIQDYERIRNTNKD
jgi:DNA (cytosine-5)-methyltransferase 1